MINKFADVQSKNIGDGTRIWQFCVVLPNAKIGRDCNINCNVFIENDVLIGDEVTIKSGVQIWDGIRISDKVFIGPNVTFTNDLSPRSKSYPRAFLQTFIEEGVTLGANSTIGPGITIHKYAMIGMASIVTFSIPAFTLWYGQPAQHKGYVTKTGKLLSLELIDKEGNEYILINEEPILKC